MRPLFIALILVYQRWFPARWKRRCLFEETCSRHTLRVMRRQGTCAGLRALLRRLRRCRPRYEVRYDGLRGEWFVVFADGTRSGEDTIATWVVEPFYASTEAAARDAAEEMRRQLNAPEPPIPMG